jgi:DNA-binding CsgD family transcriptional regulator/tetratricopeptide (TPR) repeat protein
MLAAMAFVGRERELHQLAGALQRAADGEPSRVVLVGPAGIGISRLLDELVVRLADVPGVIVARGRAYEPCIGVAYQALSDALARPLASLPDDRLARVVGPAAHDLVLLAPGLGPRLQRLGIPSDPPLLEAPEQRGSRVAEGVIGALERLAGDGVVLLALEDLHRADPATRAFVSSLLGLSRRLPVCMLVTYQDDEIHRRHPMRPLARILDETPVVETLRPRPFDRDELYRLVEDLQGGRPAGSFVAALMEGSRGNPLLATQLVAAHSTLEGIRLSDPFDEIIHARLGRLSRGAMRTLQLLAAARRPLTRAQVLGVQLPDGHLPKPGIAEAVGSGLARETDDGYAIGHDLYTEAIEGLALPPDRQAAHVALAHLLGDSPAEQAWHWSAASRQAAARDAHVAAAIRVESIDPGDTTLFHWQRALELGDTDADVRALAAETSALLARAGHAAAAAGSFRRAAALVQQAIDHRASRRVVAAAAGRGEPGARELQLEVGSLYEALGRYRWAGGDVGAGMRAMEDALEVIPVEPSRIRARALATLAQHLMLDGRFEESATIARQAREAARETGDAALAELGHATCTLGVDVSYLGRLDEGLRLLEEATDLARRAGRLDDLIRAYANRTTLLDLDSRREEALAVVKEGIAEARSGGLADTYGAFLRGNAADILFMLGRWRESEIECRAGMEWRPSGVAWFSPILYLGLVLVESKADEEAARLVGQTLLQLESVPAGQWTALVQRAAVSLALWRGEFADALSVAGREWDRVLETDDPAQVALAASTTLEAAAAATESARQRRDYGTVATAGQLANRVLPEAERRVAAGDLPRSLGARREADLHLATARAHMQRMRGRADPDAWRKLAEEWRRVPIPYQAAKARWWEAAAALHARDRRPEARDALIDALTIARELPALPLQAALRDLAWRGRIALPGIEDVERPQPGIAEAFVTWRSPAADGAVEADRPPPVAAGSGAERPASGAAGASVGSTLEAWPAESVVALASTATGRAIGERLLSTDAPHPGDRFGLSPREYEVLLVLAQGRTNREIAERLFISERTVGVHVRNILAKLGVSGRVEATGLAIRLGLVPGHPVRSDRRLGSAPP